MLVFKLLMMLYNLYKKHDKSTLSHLISHNYCVINLHKMFQTLLLLSMIFDFYSNFIHKLTFKLRIDHYAKRRKWIYYVLLRNRSFF